jgi:hypothetical protein
MESESEGVRGVKFCHWFSTLQSFPHGFAMTDFFCFSASRFAPAARTAFASGRREREEGEGRTKRAKGAMTSPARLPSPLGEGLQRLLDDPNR